mgnify:CR=1 FL=1
MLTAIKFLLVRMGKTLDSLFALFFTLLLVGFVVENLVFLSLHPLDVHDILTLLLEVVATLPVLFSLGILLAVKGS